MASKYCIAMSLHKNKQLIKRLNDGDEQAFLLVYDFYTPKIFRYIYYQVGQNKELTEDLAQQTFVKAWEFIIKRGKAVDNIQAFLYRVARNLVVDLWRNKHKESLPLMDELIETTEAAKGGGLRWQEEIDAKVSVEVLGKTLDQIHEHYREVLIMRYLEELEIDEIAKLLEKDKNSVYVLIHRATKALQKAIKEQDS